MTDSTLKAEPQNAADRLLAIVDKTASFDRNRPSTEVWADVFGVVEANPLEKQRLVSDYLSAVGIQLRAIEGALAGARIPDPLHKNALNRVRNAFSVGALNHKWQDHAGKQLDAETRMSLRWIAHVLPKEAASAALDEVGKILTLLDELDEQLAVDSLPAGLHGLLVKHATEMRRAVKLFPVQGISGLSNAVRGFIADLQLDQDEIRTTLQQADPEKVRPVLDRFNTAYKKTAEVSGDLDKISKGTGVVVGAVTSGLKLLGFV